MSEQNHTSLNEEDEVIELENFDSALVDDSEEIIEVGDFDSSLLDDSDEDEVITIDESDIISDDDDDDDEDSEDIEELPTDGEIDFSNLDLSADEDGNPVDFSEFEQEDTGTDIEAPEEPKELTADEARELTEHIRSTTDVLYVLVARAHAGKAHKALGYNNFGEYVKAEFNISRSRAYQFINQAEIIQEIEQATPDGTQFVLSEIAARDLKNYVDVLVPSIKEKTEGLEGDDASSIVEDLINDFREQSQKDKDEKDLENLSVDLTGESFSYDFDEMPEFEMPDFDGEGGGGGGSAFDNMDDFDSLDDFSNTTPDRSNEPGIEIGDPSEIKEKIENVYAFYSALTALNNLPNPAEIIESISEARRDNVNSSLPKAKAWFDEFVEVWNKKYSNTDEDLPDDSEDELSDFEFDENSLNDEEDSDNTNDSIKEMFDAFEDEEEK